METNRDEKSCDTVPLMRPKWLKKWKTPFVKTLICKYGPRILHLKKQIIIPALEYTVHTNTNTINIFLRQHPIA